MLLALIEAYSSSVGDILRAGQAALGRTALAARLALIVLAERTRHLDRRIDDRQIPPLGYPVRHT